MSQALYRKYRSRSLSDVIGQNHVTEILSRSLERGIIAHAYLLTGPRGVGKTSIARILAHEINHLPYDKSNYLDIIEIDAASNNGVEDVRDLREKVQIAPVSASKKIYIIDEVHMLSKAAFNALLKTLEEPPEHVVFILATTDVEKLPQTIISRTQRFNFRTISPKAVADHLRYIAQEEGINIDDNALMTIAQRGEGSFRDSISLLDQLRNLSKEGEPITRELVERFLGLASSELITKIVDAYKAKDLKAIVHLLDESDQNGTQPIILAEQLIQYIKDHITEESQFLALLDHLLEVNKSSQPAIKLLTVLGSPIAQKTKNAALIAPPLEISASIEELQTASQQKITHKKEAAETQETLLPQKKKTPIKRVDPQVEFDWQKLIDHTRQNYVAVFSVLSKCSYEINSTTLTLYTINNFYKKKLDDSKYRVTLAESLAAIGVSDIAIETIGTPPPPKDSTAAAVAAIMGGGEEVSIEA